MRVEFIRLWRGNKPEKRSLFREKSGAFGQAVDRATGTGVA